LGVWHRLAPSSRPSPAPTSAPDDVNQKYGNRSRGPIAWFESESAITRPVYATPTPAPTIVLARGSLSHEGQCSSWARAPDGSMSKPITSIRRMRQRYGNSNGSPEPDRHDAVPPRPDPGVLHVRHLRYRLRSSAGMASAMAVRVSSVLAGGLAK